MSLLSRSDRVPPFCSQFAVTKFLVVRQESERSIRGGFPMVAVLGWNGS